MAVSTQDWPGSATVKPAHQVMNGIVRLVDQVLKVPQKPQKTSEKRPSFANAQTIWQRLCNLAQRSMVGPHLLQQLIHWGVIIMHEDQDKCAPEDSVEKIQINPSIFQEEVKEHQSGCQGSAAMPDWERWLLLVLLWPVLWLQGKYVRRVTPRMPEPQGDREGIQGSGPILRVLVAGDSGAVGVGVPSQDQALCGQLVHRFSQHHTVKWFLLAANGMDSPGLVKLLEDAPDCAFDVVVLSMGANDATCLCSPQRWVEWQNQLADVIEMRFAPNLLVHSAVPPMHICMALPQPLRWFMGRWAVEMNRRLSDLLSGHAKRTMHWHPAATATNGLAMDGIHPSSLGYAMWADSLCLHIQANHVLGRVLKPQ